MTLFPYEEPIVCTCVAHGCHKHVFEYQRTGIQVIGRIVGKRELERHRIAEQRRERQEARLHGSAGKRAGKQGYALFPPYAHVFQMGIAHVGDFKDIAVFPLVGAFLQLVIVSLA